MKESEIKNSMFLSFSFHSKILNETANIFTRSKKDILERFTNSDDLEAAKTILSCLLDKKYKDLRKLA